MGTNTIQWKHVTDELPALKEFVIIYLGDEQGSQIFARRYLCSDINPAMWSIRAWHSGETYVWLADGMVLYREHEIQYWHPALPSPAPPEPPAGRLLKENGGNGTCKICGSSLKCKYKIFGKKKCIHPQCKSNRRLCK